MNLVLLDRQGLEFVVAPEDRRGAVASFFGTPDVRSVALAPSRTVAVRQLRYREHSFRVAFCPLLASHRTEQAQIVAFDGKAATPRLEVANGAMLVQNGREEVRAAAARPDRVDRLVRPEDMVLDLHDFSVKPFTVDHHSGVCQNPGGLRQGERAETHEESVKKAREGRWVRNFVSPYAGRPTRARMSQRSAAFAARFLARIVDEAAFARTRTGGSERRRSCI
jgi:hypothetical protein